MEPRRQKPKLTISGYRGIWGKDLDEQITFLYALAFAKLIKSKGSKSNNNKQQKIIVGRDARQTGTQMLSAVLYAFQKENIEIEDAGIIPTPSILLLVRKLSFDGGIIITASHNPLPYNGLKFVMGNALFATQSEINTIEEIKNTLNEKYIPTQTQESPDNKKYRQIHIDEILKNIDTNLIKSKKFKVALDPINSAGSVITQELLKELGCETFLINEKQNGEFAHTPEPIIENLKQISEIVKKNKVDIGFAQDPDADRLVVIKENGEVLSEEYTLALCVKNILAKNPIDIVVNMSTSNLNKYITDSYNVQIHRTKIGELNVVEKMLEINAAIGGEGNGGVIYPKINTARDSLVGIALILELMAKENKNKRTLLSEIVESFPKYIMQKEKITFTGDLNLLYEKLKKQFPDAFFNELDGIRFDFTDSSWIHIRPSNTEPVIRIIGEAIDPKYLETLFEKTRLTLSSK